MADARPPDPARPDGPPRAQRPWWHPLQWPVTVLLLLVRAYQLLLSPALGPTCRFYPSCSAYAVEALRTRGALVGLWLTARRLARCHPWNPGGVDPVPPRRARTPSPGSDGPAPRPPAATDRPADGGPADGADGDRETPARRAAVPERTTTP